MVTRTVTGYKRAEFALDAVQMLRNAREFPASQRINLDEWKSRLLQTDESGNRRIHFFAEICDEGMLRRIASDKELLQPYSSVNGGTVAYIVWSRGGRDMEKQLLRVPGFLGMDGRSDCESMAMHLAKDGKTIEGRRAAQKAMGHRS